MSNMYQKPGKLKVELTFKEPGKLKTITSKPGKQVRVDRHGFDLGKYVVWSTSKTYAIVAGEELHNVVEFK